ncbi:MAG: tetratricopeptide repeat protein [Bdellovibrionia bacterium]
MDSIISNSGSVHRKSIKRPDGFLRSLNGFFDSIAHHLNWFLAGVAGLLVLGFIAAYFINQKGTQSEQARNALYLAEKALESEVQALQAPPSPENEKTNAALEKSTSQKKSDRANAALRDQLRYVSVNVDQKFPETLKKLEEVVRQFPSTRAAFEARLKLGELYYSHGEASKSLSWFEKSVQSASSKFEKTLALSSLGYALENTGKKSDAVTAFQKALSLGQTWVKGDLLLATARCYEALSDRAKARSTYDQILAELPNTDYSQAAEASKSLLEP